MRVEDCSTSDMFETHATISIKAFDRTATLNRLRSKACFRRNAVNVGSRNTEFSYSLSLVFGDAHEDRSFSEYLHLHTRSGIIRIVLIGILAMQHTPQRDQAEQRQGGQSRPGKKGALWPHFVPQNARDHAG